MKLQLPQKELSFFSTKEKKIGISWAEKSNWPNLFVFANEE